MFFSNKRFGMGRGRLSRRTRWTSGCLSWALMLTLLFGFWGLAWQWLSPKSSLTESNPRQTNLKGVSEAFAQGDLDNAIMTARQIWQTEQSPEALLAVVRSLVYRSYSDYDHAIDRNLALSLAESAMQKYPAHPDVLTAYALALHTNKRSLEGYRMAQRALLVSPNYPPAQIVLAMTYGGTGVFDKAFSLAQTLTQTAPPDWKFDAWRVYAITLSDLGQYKEARQTIEKAINTHKRLPLAYFERALYAMQTGDFNTATEAYFQILAFQPDNVKARLRLCELSSLLREKDKALSYCREVTQLAPAWADGWYRLGREYYLQGNFQQAQTYLKQCSTLQNNQSIPRNERHFDCWYLQGQSAEKLGDCVGLHAVYADFQRWTANSDYAQQWTYPPEGPPACE